MNNITRRKLLQILGAAGISSAISFNKSYSQNSKTAPLCILTPEQTAGPFYFDTEQVREDITEDRKGLALNLLLTVVNSSDCKPIKDAIVDIWHADADGRYSGYSNLGVDTKGEKFLRGIQITNLEGTVNFKTIYPGSYPGRVPHIHFKIYLDNKNLVTSQLYFPTEISKKVYEKHSAYNKDRVKYLDESGDLVLRWSGGANNLKMNIKEDKSGYIATHTIGIKI
ncbi:MAG: intradiol ring-cleavage dioxygenase [Thermodesulfobacteriota bacterium]